MLQFSGPPGRGARAGPLAAGQPPQSPDSIADGVVAAPAVNQPVMCAPTERVSARHGFGDGRGSGPLAQVLDPQTPTVGVGPAQITLCNLRFARRVQSWLKSSFSGSQTADPLIVDAVALDVMKLVRVRAAARGRWLRIRFDARIAPDDAANSRQHPRARLKGDPISGYLNSVAKPRTGTEFSKDGSHDYCIRRRTRLVDFPDRCPAGVARRAERSCGRCRETSQPAIESKDTADAVAPGDKPSDGQESAAPSVKKPLSKDPPGMTRLSPEYDVWIDRKKKRVVMDGTVCLQQGTLEMFACLKGTKEHESVVFVDTKAFIVHAGLLAVGAKEGSPARFQPEYRPASGTPIDISLIWTDEKGAVQRCRAQDWVRNVRTQKALDSAWVFAGSGFFLDENSGQKIYLAEGGDFICVSNFPGAMLDLPVESSKTNEELLFEAFKEHIPPRGTRVRMVLTPRLEDAPKTTEAAEPKPAPAEEPSKGTEPE